MMIGFWGPLHGTYSTSNMIAVATAMAEQTKKKVLITQTHYTLNNLERPLLGTQDDIYDNSHGIDGVIRTIRTTPVPTADDIAPSLYELGKGLMLLVGTRMPSRILYDSDYSYIVKALQAVQPLFDYVLIDINSGTSQQSMDILSQCDTVVVSLRQDPYMISSFIKLKEEFPFLNEKKIFYLFGNYDSGSRFNMFNLRIQKFPLLNKKNSGAIPHSAAYMDALTNSTACKFIRKSLGNINRYSLDAPFFRELSTSVDGIVKMAAIQRKPSKKEEDRVENRVSVRRLKQIDVMSSVSDKQQDGSEGDRNAEERRVAVSHASEGIA